MQNLDIATVIIVSFALAAVAAGFEDRYRKPAKARRRGEAAEGLRATPIDWTHPVWDLPVTRRGDTSRTILPKGTFQTYEIGE